MELRELHSIFEKMYFNENEIKEQITIRIQVVFTLMFAIVTVASYMLRMLDLERYLYVGAAIIACLVVSIFCMAFAASFAIRAFWGNTFKLMPYANNIKDYHGDLVEYNKEVEAFKAAEESSLASLDIRSEMETFLSKSYADCATFNSEVNQERSSKVYQSFGWLINACIPLGLAGAMFVGFDMDVSSPRKNFQIIDKYVGDQLGKVGASVDQVSKKTDELKEMLMSGTKNSSNVDVSKPERAPKEPIKNIPLKPVQPKMRMALEDMQSHSVEVSNESSKK